MPGPDYEVEPEHLPMRGDAVEKWLKAYRDKFTDPIIGARTMPEWNAIDGLLDDYRLRADTGLTLADDLSETGQYGTDYAELSRGLSQILQRLEENRLRFQSRPSSSFRDERMRVPQHRVTTATIKCICDHDQADTTCVAHGKPLLLDAHTKTTTCGCPPPL